MEVLEEKIRKESEGIVLVEFGSVAGGVGVDALL